VKRRVRLLACVLVTAIVAALVGCGRHVVVEPESVARFDDRAWKVKSEPTPVVLVAPDGGLVGAVQR
jgi:hypothetical protein